MLVVIPVGRFLVVPKLPVKTYIVRVVEFGKKREYEVKADSREEAIEKIRRFNARGRISIVGNPK